MSTKNNRNSVPESTGEELFLEQARAYYREIKTVAENAPHGHTFDHTEAAVMPKGRELIRKSFEIIVQEQINDLGNTFNRYSV
jgi:hypothetical protein